MPRSLVLEMYWKCYIVIWFFSFPFFFLFLDYLGEFKIYWLEVVFNCKLSLAAAAASSVYAMWNSPISRPDSRPWTVDLYLSISFSLLKWLGNTRLEFLIKLHSLGRYNCDRANTYRITVLHKSPIKCDVFPLTDLEFLFTLT